MENFIFCAVMEIQNNHVPKKKDHLRGAHSSFMIEILSKKNNEKKNTWKSMR